MNKMLKYKKSDSIHVYQLLILVAISLVINPLYSNNKVKKSLETVVIDAGHGGKDPGAIVGKAREKDIVLDIALKLGHFIKERLPEVNVIYTRSTDVFIPLFERSVIANKNNADLFISIHANYCPTPSIKGTETYVLGLHRTEDNLNVAKKENSVILLEKDYTTRYEGFDPNLSESYIMFELIQNTHIDQSVSFAGILQDSFRKHAQRANRDVRQAGFLVLRETAMPGVLIESGYLSNESEANYLMTDEGRGTIALSIFQSFKLYKEKFDSRLNLASGESKKEPKEVIDSAPSKQHIAEIKKETSVVLNQEKEKKIQNSIKEEKKAINKTKDEKKIQEPTKETHKQVSKEADKITFAIQLSAYPKKLSLNSKIFKGIENIFEMRIDNYYKYYCLETKSISMARQNLLIIKVKIPDAFIVAFKNGESIPIKEALNSK
jgi:N-acetylmuramoyl-L-alanine amidase